jgi:hypothetical protein
VAAFVLAAAGGGFAAYCYRDVRTLQYTTCDVFFKWKLAEQGAICLIAAVLLALLTTAWYIILPVTLC